MSDAYLGRGGRLAGGPAPELVAAGYAHEVAAGPRLARGLSLSDIAHAVALAETGAIPDDQARALLAGLLALHEIPGEAFPWDPRLGDAFNSREHELRERVGTAAAGWLSAGRPRREAFRVGLRLVARDGVVALHDAVVDLAEALVAHADRHAGDLAADYTYLQPAQPTTLGHLMLAYAYPALRDAERLRRAHAFLDASVAGAGGSAGSRWPLDRDRLAALLGCPDVVTHVKDAMWQHDGYVELLAAVATLATHQSQIGQDLEIMVSQEFALAELADEHSRASALMPQKRNPYALAVIRSTAGTVSGDLAGLLVALHTGSARTDHFHVLNGMVPRVLDEAGASARLCAAVVAGMRLDPERAARVAREAFVTAADVADLTAQRCGMDYRTAHKVVGRAVRDLVESGRGVADLTSEVLADAAEAVTGDRVALDAAGLAEALDPAAAVASRRQRGSAAPGEVEPMIDDCRAQIAAARRWGVRTADRARDAEHDLLALAREIAAGG
jgi:argininosuccinate lyase